MAPTITKFAHLKIPLEDVVKATDDFSDANIIGGGGFGSAYKGQLLLSGKLMKIAALRLDRKQGLGDLEFWTEISVLSDLKHANLVSLIGFCDEKHEKIIVITHETNGSLGQYLNSPNLTWTQRLRISVGVARALSYLHHYKRRRYSVIHRNINSSTILLDQNWEARLSGFMVSIKQPVNRMNQKQVVLCEPIGTIGYVDPAIEKLKGANHKLDIYSLGVVLFEILCGRMAFIPKDDNRLLVPLVIHHYEKETLNDIIHPDLLNDQMSVESLNIYSEVAYSCLQEDQTHRPDTDHILGQLEEALEFQHQRDNLENNFKHLKICLNDIKLATDNFSETYEISSSGGSSIFYKAQLELDIENLSFVQGEDIGQHPKRYNIVTLERFLPIDRMREIRFYTSIRMITSVEHQNIATLVGFCEEGSEMILVTENVCNGYLVDYLGNTNNNLHILTWEKRLKICIDVAYALNYLHYHMEDQNTIIHCNIGCNNIGLDDNWGAKITGFEKSIFLPQDQEVVLQKYGAQYEDLCNMYVDPHFKKTGQLNKDFDVYAFGVVMLEILCGRKAYDPIYLEESIDGLPYVATQRYRMGSIKDMVDPLLNDGTHENNFGLHRGPNKDSLNTFIKIAFRCMLETQDQCLTIKVVIMELEKALLFQDDPSYYCLKDDRVQLYDDQVINESEKTLELELIHKNFHGNNLEHLKIRLADIKLATNNFSDRYEIPTFSECTLYRVELNHFDEQNPSSAEGKAKSERHITVVIKRYPYQHAMYQEKEFFNEIEMLMSVKHRNIVALIGFCVEDSEMILVIENLSNGFLCNYLGDIYYDKRRVLTWEKRLKICIDVANALAFIHSEMEDQNVIIHHDICSYNIGLDEKWRAKITDFRWSVFLPTNQEEVFLNLWIGRPVYVDPEYTITCRLKRESDVYSFSVFLFEILCGRKANDPIYLKETEKGLSYLARQKFCTGALEDMIDPILKEETSENNFVLNRGPNKDSLHTFIAIALQCGVETQYHRPTMKVIVKELEKALFFQKNNNPIISLDDIKVATQNFHDVNYVGGGGFGRVFKGNLQDGDGFKTIVAKRLNTKLGQGEQQFLTELQILLEYRHENVIGLVGYCDEKDEKVIVYEYEPRGSLDRSLNNVSLTWVKRLNICIDVASALYFLHKGYKNQAVIHRDIKSANILLNHDWKAKLADFGLSLISPIAQKIDHVIDYTCGTLGYMDPLYKKSGFLTIESDIYSFGVVMLEILCGRSTFTVHKHVGHYLPDFVKNKFEEGKHGEVVFEKIREHILPKSLTTFLEIAYQCLHHEREKRPTIKVVLKQLKKALEFQKDKDNPKIPLEDIKLATQNFHECNCIREVEFGKFYMGNLKDGDDVNNIVAKRLDTRSSQGEKQFWRELQILLEYKHTNVISVVGYCDEHDEKIIVYEFVCKGSLDGYLNDASLTWRKRLNICIDIASALNFIHGGVGRQAKVIHGNITSANILLNQHWKPKLADFGISLIIPINQETEYVIDYACGTPGYVDPLYKVLGFLTTESDIYSFGVVLFEMLCGRSTFAIHKQEGFYLPDFIKNKFKERKHDEMVFEQLRNQIKPKSLITFAEIAYQCLHAEREKRPTSNAVLKQLKKALEFQKP